MRAKIPSYGLVEYLCQAGLNLVVKKGGCLKYGILTLESLAIMGVTICALVYVPIPDCEAIRRAGHGVHNVRYTW